MASAAAVDSSNSEALAMSYPVKSVTSVRVVQQYDIDNLTCNRVPWLQQQLQIHLTVKR